jgi:elongation factor G
VAYREAISQMAEFNYTHKKQTGGSGQYGRVAGFMEPLDEGEYEFVDKITGGSIPREFISSCDKGFKACLAKGSLIGSPITGVRLTINDGAAHSVDSSDMAFQQAGGLALRDAAANAKRTMLEPYAAVTILITDEYVGAIMSDLSGRRGRVTGSESVGGGRTKITADVPELELSRYPIELRSITHGTASFTRDFTGYEPMPAQLAAKHMAAD